MGDWKIRSYSVKSTVSELNTNAAINPTLLPSAPASSPQTHPPRMTTTTSVSTNAGTIPGVNSSSTYLDTKTAYATNESSPMIESVIDPLREVIQAINSTLHYGNIDVELIIYLGRS
jgi:hypothetical protein